MIDPINPMGTDGFEFVEFTGPDTKALGELFELMGFTAIARHRSKDCILYRQGDINLIVNAQPHSFASRFASQHGESACAMAFRVKDAAKAYERALQLGAWGVESRPNAMELNIPAIKGIGDSLLYLVDRYEGNSKASIYDMDFIPIEGADPAKNDCGLKVIDHLTHNVHRGAMDKWASFYETLFNFREIRYFDIEGKLTGLKSRALTSPCAKIRIPINESSDDKSQIEEYLREYKGEGIQHIALTTENIYETIEKLKARGVNFLTTPDTYYELLDKRLPGHGEDIERLKANKILLDGAPGGGLLLQIFTETCIGPIFFEIIQRKGDEGFGEGNFRALFESIELDQVRRGVIQADEKVSA